MLRAIIDIGSNSIKMRIAAVERGRIRVVRDETEVVRLGRGMSESGVLSGESMRASCEAVCRMTQRASLMGAEILAVGTMALRTAKNSGEFVRMVREACGQEIHILSGEEEAKYSWLGAVDGLGIAGDAVMFDSGGGSTEFVMGSECEMMRVVSVPVGAVNLSERFFCVYDSPIKKSACDAAIAYVRNMLTENHIEAFRAETSSTNATTHNRHTEISSGNAAIPHTHTGILSGNATIPHRHTEISSGNAAIPHDHTRILTTYTEMPHAEAFSANTLPQTVIAVGGGAVTMASVKHACENFTPSKLHGSILTQRDIVRQIRMYASLTLKERENVIGLPASRADVILGSACIILTALRILNAPSCIVSINGLRHGLLIRDG